MTNRAPSALALALQRHGLITELNEHDVLLGRGLGPSKFVGNMRFRELAESRKAEYNVLVSYNDKAAVANEVYLTIRLRGGRFLKLVHTNTGFPPRAVVETGVWEEVDAKTALEKCKQLLREKEAPSKEARRNRQRTKKQTLKDSANNKAKKKSSPSPAVVARPLLPTSVPAAGGGGGGGDIMSFAALNGYRAPPMLPSSLQAMGHGVNNASLLLQGSSLNNSSLLLQQLLLREQQQAAAADRILQFYQLQNNGLVPPPPPLRVAAGYGPLLADNNSLQNLVERYLENGILQARLQEALSQRVEATFAARQTNHTASSHSAVHHHPSSESDQRDAAFALFAMTLAANRP